MEKLTGLVTNLVMSNDLVDCVKLAQMDDEELNEMMEKTSKIIGDSNSVIKFRMEAVCTQE